ncbi:unnamed protein product [Cuscuta campestris]|uniref:Uncharacterized protein n=1 Tax=Cuscuta campestris TaxID=132261 RepID=A0A484MD27_9ASTE|nr:unnamed protein product [Cuscuta campestris]
MILQVCYWKDKAFLLALAYIDCKVTLGNLTFSVCSRGRPSEASLLPTENAPHTDCHISLESGGSVK